MNALRSRLFIVCLIALAGCSGGTGGGIGSFFNSNPSNSPNIISASQVETAKLQAAITADPVYKIDDSEIDLLQKEGIITDANKAQLQAIQ